MFGLTVCMCGWGSNAAIHALLIDAVTVCVWTHTSSESWGHHLGLMWRQVMVYEHYLNSASEEEVCEMDRARECVCVLASMRFIVTNPPLSVSQLSFCFLTCGVSEGLGADFYYTAAVCVCVLEGFSKGWGIMAIGVHGRCFSIEQTKPHFLHLSSHLFFPVSLTPVQTPLV